METTATKLRTILLVGILSISMLSAGIGSVGAAPAHSSIGSVSVDDRSAAGSTPAPPADPDEWDLRSAKHSGTMSAEIIIDEETVRGITITDDVNHEGRDVSIAKDALSGWIDEIPDEVTGVHENGDRWTSNVRISNNRVIVYVPEFSTQTITFSSRVSITADPAEDGATFDYEVANSSTISDLSLTLTGELNSELTNVSTTAPTGSSSIPLDIGGTVDPTNEEITLTSSSQKNWTTTVPDSEVTDIVIDGNAAFIATNGDTIQKIWINNQTTDWSVTDDNGVGELSVDESRVYAPDTSNPYVKAFDRADGSELYADSFGGWVKTTARGPNSLWVGSWEGQIIETDATRADNDKNTFQIFGSSTQIEDIKLNGSSIYLAGSNGSNSGVARASKSGTTDWITGTAAPVLAVSDSADHVYAATSDGQVIKLNKNDGSIVWNVSLSTKEVDDIEASDKQLYAAVGSNGIIRVDPSDGSARNTVSVPSQPGAVTREGSQIYVGYDNLQARSVWTAQGVVVSRSGSDLIGPTTVDGSQKATVDLSRGDEAVNISIDSGSSGVAVSLQEHTQTTDPSVTINSDTGRQIINHTGSLADGSTVDLSQSVNKSIISDNVSLSVSVSESVTSGPVGQVGVNYAHDAQESKQIDYAGEEFSERYSITHQWPYDRSSASITIPWSSDRVVDVRSVQINGQETTQYSAADGELTVDLGSVQSGDQTNVTAVGSKVSVSGGEISVDDPTTQGDDLDSGISVQSLSSQTLEIDVSNSYHVSERDRMIYVPDSSASWSGADPITRVGPGSQTVEIDPTSSSSFRLRSAGVGSSIPSGDAVLRMEDAAEPRVSVSPGRTEGDTLKLTYHDTVSGDYYRVVDSEGNPLDTDRASSPAEFRISDTTGIFSIEQFSPEAIVSGISSGAAAVSSGGSLIPPWLALIATLSASILGLAYVGTRTEIGSSMLGRRVIIGGGIVLGYVGAELVTGERLYRIALDAVSGGISGLIGAILSALGAGAGAGSGAISGLADIGFISLVLGIGLLVALYAIDQRTEIDIPRAGWGIAAGLISVWMISQFGIGTGVSIGGQQSLSIVLAIGIVLGLLALDQRGILSIPLPLYAGTALLAGVYVLETLAPGSVLGPLQSGLDEVGPLIWLAIIGGALLLLYVWLRSNRPEITIPGLRGGNR